MRLTLANLLIKVAKAYPLKPRAGLRKDRDDKAYFFVGYVEEHIDYKIFVSDINGVITTLHVVFKRLYQILLMNILKN